MSTRVLFIGGLGRSGSTLLELLLGGVAGVASIGEVRHLWERGLRDDSLCACGDAFHACPFWGAVGEEAFGGWGRLDPEQAIATARAVDRHRRLPVAATRLGARSAALARYSSLLRPLFAAAAKVSGAQVVVDASKDPPHGFVLRQAGLDVRAVHIVRDPRGVAHSWAKRVVRPDAGRAGAVMTRMSPGRTALMWLDANLLVELLAVRVPTVRVRYEELVADPGEQVRRVLGVAGLEADRMSEVELLAGGVPRHAIAGNPMRFAGRPFSLLLDDEWRRSMPRRERRLVSAITSPLLPHYSYSVSA